MGANGKVSEAAFEAMTQENKSCKRFVRWRPTPIAEEPTNASSFDIVTDGRGEFDLPLRGQRDGRRGGEHLRWVQPATPGLPMTFDQSLEYLLRNAQ